MWVYTPSLRFNGSWNKRLLPQCNLPVGLMSAQLREPSLALPECEIMPDNEAIKKLLLRVETETVVCTPAITPVGEYRIPAR